MDAPFAGVPRQLCNASAIWPSAVTLTNRMSSFAINGVIQSEYPYNPLGQQVIHWLGAEQMRWRSPGFDMFLIGDFTSPQCMPTQVA
ncbi:hypothetical protein QTO30_01675 [Yoonia sp. GPGPB17]|uniref:hypothetical protein n=1 Tax=Yoonia sp. GPGPB17 TaxID=3026147 RepID=UPI0030C4F29F